ncbi:unnamed protein product, partial [Symbiodinium necroappetens]
LHIAADHMFEEKDVVESVQVKEPPEDVSKVLRAANYNLASIPMLTTKHSAELGQGPTCVLIINALVCAGMELVLVQERRDPLVTRLIGRGLRLFVLWRTLLTTLIWTPNTFFKVFVLMLPSVDSMQVVQVKERLTRRVREQLKEVVAFYQSVRLHEALLCKLGEFATPKRAEADTVAKQLVKVGASTGDEREQAARRRTEMKPLMRHCFESHAHTSTSYRLMGLFRRGNPQPRSGANLIARAAMMHGSVMAVHSLLPALVAAVDASLTEIAIRAGRAGKFTLRIRFT